VRGEPIAQLCRVDLSGLEPWEPCLHLVEIGFAEPPKSPLAVGRSTSTGPWTWECGWVHLKGREPLPLERPWGIAWAAYGRESAHRSCRVGEGQVETAGSAQVDRFKVSLPSFTVLQTSQTIVTSPAELQLPEPRSQDHSIPFPRGRTRMVLPYRHADLLSAPPEAAVRQVHAEVHWNGRAEGGLNYRGWASRYDLVSIHRDSGELALTLGLERDLDPEEFPAQLPQQHIPLYSLYTTKDGVEAIALLGWHDMVQDSRRADHVWWLETSRQTLRRTFRKLRRGGTIRLAGYGDSLTSLGSRDPAMIDAPNGPARDTLGYFERYGDDWKSSVPLFSAEEGGVRRHHRLGWNWQLKAAMEEAYDVEVEYLNWGIPGTTTEPTHKTIDGRLYPNGSEPRRLERLIASEPDLVTVCFGMNDIGEPDMDTYGNMRRICDAITAAGADVLVVGLCQQNPGFDSRDHSLWRLSYDQIASAAHDSGVAFLPTWEIFGDGNEAATGLSRWSHSAASMTNHPGARELGLIGRYMAKIII
jgi:lysophospholipase L1-like esterase